VEFVLCLNVKVGVFAAGSAMFATFEQAPVFWIKPPMNAIGHFSEGVVTSNLVRESNRVNFEANCAFVKVVILVGKAVPPMVRTFVAVVVKFEF
jgi:hypothetical protein